MVNVSAIIRELIYEWGVENNPALVNSGDCEDFAEKLADIINNKTDWKNEGYANVMWDSDYCDMDSMHCFVYFNGLFYDSECLNGVDHPGDLPIYSRINCQYLMEEFEIDVIKS